MTTTTADSTTGQRTTCEKLQGLRVRIGEEHFARRMRMQSRYKAKRVSSGPGFARDGGLRVYWENLALPLAVVNCVLKLVRYDEKARKNTIDYRVEHVAQCFGRLPPAFHRFRILQISDLHAEGCIDGCAALCRLLETLEYDLCVVTGDFRYATTGRHEAAIRGVAKVLEAIDSKKDVLGVLGNHDCIEMVPPLEDLGVRMLLNESVCVRRGGDSIWVAGVDDGHYFGTCDIPRATGGVPRDAWKLLLSHSPEQARVAKAAGVDYCLSGHTHGGQICLPFGVPVITNTACSRRYAAGSWKYGELRGYTSRGTGSSGIPARVFCPPEVTIHTLFSREAVAASPSYAEVLHGLELVTEETASETLRDVVEI